MFRRLEEAGWNPPVRATAARALRIDWSEVPLDGGFRIQKPCHSGVQRRASPEEIAQQVMEYDYGLRKRAVSLVQSLHLTSVSTFGLLARFIKTHEALKGCPMRGDTVSLIAMSAITLFCFAASTRCGGRWLR